MKAHISDLNGQVFIDALTHVKNKGAFSKVLGEIQEQINSGSISEFAIGIFDCDNLKVINDRYGHDKGDVYLITATRAICEIFKHNPVFRIGGDEFAVILRNEDYSNMDTLMELFDKRTEDTNANAKEPWEEIWISKGFSVFDKNTDKASEAVMKRADQLMYENKRERKKHK